MAISARRLLGAVTAVVAVALWAAVPTQAAVTMSAPQNASRSSDVTPTFTGTAETGLDASDTVTVNVYPGSTPADPPARSLPATRDVTTGDWTVTLDAGSALAAGTYTARAEQVVAGDPRFGPSITFTVDTVSPALSITAPASGASTDDASPPAVGAAGDAEGDSPVVGLRLFPGAGATGTPVQAASVSRSGSAWAAGLAPLTPGTYTLEATQTDDVGNSTIRTTTFAVVPASSPAAVGTTKSSDTGSKTVSEKFRPLSPFPVVRFVGRLTRTGARFSLVSIRAPAGSAVEVRCKGRSCPFRKRTTRVSPKVTGGRRVKVKELTGRSLLGGVVLEIRVTAKDRVGKYTRFRIRRGKAPLRLDTCVMAGAPDPVRCPS